MSNNTTELSKSIGKSDPDGDLQEFPNNSSVKSQDSLNAALGRLQGLANRVSTFQGSFEQQYNSQRVMQENRLQVIRDAISHLDRVIQRESSARVETLTATNAGLEEHLNEVTRVLMQRIDTIDANANQRLAKLRERIGVLQQKLQTEIETRKADFESLNNTISSESKVLRAQLDAIAIERLDEEKEIHAAAQTDCARLAEAIEVRNSACKSALSSLKDGCELLNIQKVQVLTQTREEMLEIINGLEAQLAQEIKSRLVSDNNLIQSIDEVSKEMEESLKVVLNALG